MANPYAGRICPHCHKPIAAADTVVICDSCGIPQHLDCWRAHGHCGTPVCKGKIRQVIQGVAAPMPQQAAPQPVQQAPRFERVYASDSMAIQKDAQILIESIQLVRNSNTGEISAQVQLRNLSQKVISGALVDLHCKDAWGSDLQGTKNHQFLNLQVPFGGTFGQGAPIQIGDKNAYKATVSIRKILYADHSIGDFSEEPQIFPAATTLMDHFRNAPLAEEFVRQTNPQARYAPVTEHGYTRCSCGSIHSADWAVCPVCGLSREAMLAAFDAEYLSTILTQRMQQQLEQQRLAQEAAQAEAARIAEEQRIAQEKAEQLRKERKKKRKMIALIVTPIVAVALIAAFIFLGIPYIQYTQAQNALESGQFDVAFGAFSNLGNFLDSAELAKSARYRQAEEALKKKDFDEAYEIFQSLGGYSNSAEKCKQVLIAKGEHLLATGDYQAAKEVFLSLDGYGNSADLAKEADYRIAVDMMDSGDYEGAYVLFQTLGKYSDSANMLKEIRYRQANGYLEAGKYKDAYLTYRGISGYKDSADLVDETVSRWVTAALEHTNSSLANSLVGTVRFFTTKQSSQYFSQLKTFISDHTDPTFWFDYGPNQVSISMNILLTAAPSNSNEVAYYQALFQALGNKDATYETVFRDNIRAIRNCWSVKFVQNMAVSDPAIEYFLEGEWTNSSTGYYLKFTEQRDGSTYCSYNLPRPTQPSNTAFFDIHDMVFVWEDYDGNVLTNVWRFTLTKLDTLAVYCYQNGKTYYLYR